MAAVFVATKRDLLEQSMQQRALFRGGEFRPGCQQVAAC
jgi:hypothetical protein